MKINRVSIERKHWNQIQRITTATNLPSGTRWRTAAGSRSSCSNSSIATLQSSSSRSTWQVYIQLHTRKLCSSVQLQYNYNLSGQGTLLWNRTRCLRNKKRNNTSNNTRQSSSGGGNSTIYAYKTDISIAQTTPQPSSYIFLHWNK